MKPKVLAVMEAPEPSKGFLAKLAKDTVEIKKVALAQVQASLGPESPDLILLIVGKGGKGAAEKVQAWIGDIHLYDPNLPVLVLSAESDVEAVVAAMKKGAYDYFSSPYSPEKIRHAMTQAIRYYQLTKKVFLLESQAGVQGRCDELVGISAPIQELFKMIGMVAKSNATVLIMGESGTGKELVAKAIHHFSDRAKAKFIDINCGAIPKELLENELFGHEKGSFTGADRRYIGSCERADGGTLFLDEISEMDPSLQVKLLRVLQERSFQRVGGAEKVSVDIRVIAATNRDIKKEVEKGTFREDLYYRLNVVPLHVPALRERREDVPLLAKHFLTLYAQRNNKSFVDFEPEVMESMINYDWPGNVRELENSIERIVVLNNDSHVRNSYLPRFIQKTERRIPFSSDFIPGLSGDQKILPLAQVERYAIEAALGKCNNDIVEAAAKLKIGQATLYRKIKQYGLKVSFS